ncbi:MAG: GspH/FimT family pseudopilin [Pseudomonadota bacterium]|nr:GspH/FimT family pseudopilin [Pseudomonadota bacterium]
MVVRPIERGFTLVELMVTLSVAVILLTTAIPSLRSFTTRNQIASIESGLMASLALARAEAAKRGTFVFVVARPGGPSNNEYANGWDLYADVDGNGTFSAADFPALRHYDALPAGLTLHGAAQIRFNPSGYLTPAATLTFKVCQAVADTDGFLVTLPPSGAADVSAFAVASAADCTS